MEIKVFYIALAIAMTLGSVGIVAAEPSVDQILTSTYGANHYQEVTSTSDFVLKPASYSTVTIHTKIDDHEAAYADPVGWYVAGSGVPSVLNPLYSTPTAGNSADFSTNSQFGMYINSAGSGYIYSQNSLNSRKLVKLYKIDKNQDGNYDNDNCYVFAFEDIAVGGDSDYQDIVLEVNSESSLIQVPEFPTVAVPVAAVLGLLFIFSRKKEKL